MSWPRLNPNERRLLLWASRPTRVKEKPTPPLDHVRWRVVLDVAERLAFAPTLSWALRAGGLGSCLPGDLRERVDATVESSAVRNTTLLFELRELVDLIEEQGIRVITLKGAALLAAHYPNPAARHIEDIDLWVDPSRIGETEPLLDNAHWRTLPDYEELTVDGRTNGEAYHGHDKELMARSSPLGTVVDVHKRPDHHTLSPQAAFERAWTRSRRVEFRGGELCIPSAVDLRAHLTTHVLTGHFGSPELWLRQLADMDVLGVSADEMRGSALSSRERTFESFMRRIEVASHQHPDGGIARSVVVPTPAAYRALMVVSHLGSVGMNVGRNLFVERHMLRYKLWPHPTYLQEKYGSPKGLQVRLTHLKHALLGD